MKSKKYFPMFIDLEEKKVVVVGGGKIATRRILALTDFCKNIYVYAPEVSEEIEDLAAKGMLTLEKRTITKKDLQFAFMVIAATNDHRLNDNIGQICKEEGIYTNVISDKDACDFHFPGIVKHDGVVIGVNAGGLDHAKAKRARVDLEQYAKTRNWY